MIAVTHPFLYYALLAAAMTACIHLFVSIKCDLARLDKKLSKRIQTTDSEVSRIGAQTGALETRVAGWSARVQGLEDNIEAFSLARSENTPRAGIDLNQRTQVIRRARRGERPEQIAVELGMPKNEVDLLVKVHRAVVRVF
jgi:hypothetical protein